MFSLAAVQVSALLLLQKVLESFELVNVERLQADQLLSHDQSHLLSCVYASMPEKHPHKQGEVSKGPSGLFSWPRRYQKHGLSRAGLDRSTGDEQKY